MVVSDVRKVAFAHRVNWDVDQADNGPTQVKETKELHAVVSYYRKPADRSRMPGGEPALSSLDIRMCAWNPGLFAKLQTGSIQATAEVELQLQEHVPQRYFKASFKCKGHPHLLPGAVASGPASDDRNSR